MVKKRIYKRYLTGRKRGGQRYRVKKKSGVTSRLLDKAKKKEIEEVMSKGGGSLELPLTAKKFNEEMSYLISGKPRPILTGKKSEAWIIKEPIDLKGGYVPKGVIHKSATLPKNELRWLINNQSLSRKRAKKQFKETGSFKGYKKPDKSDPI